MAAYFCAARTAPAPPQDGLANAWISVVLFDVRMAEPLAHPARRLTTSAVRTTFLMVKYLLFECCRRHNALSAFKIKKDESFRNVLRLVLPATRSESLMSELGQIVQPVVAELPRLLQNLLMLYSSERMRSGSMPTRSAAASSPCNLTSVASAANSEVCASDPICTLSSLTSF